MVLDLLTTCSDHLALIKITIAYSMTSAAGAIPVLFDSTGLSANVIAFRFEITRMTGSTIRCVSAPGVHKRIVYTIAVAAATAWICIVVTRVVILIRVIRVMAEVGRPVVCCMTHITLHRRG